jgi:hypothetical protein
MDFYLHRYPNETRLVEAVGFLPTGEYEQRAIIGA